MKFFIASDFHGDASTNGLDRFDEIRDAAFVVADAAIDVRRTGAQAVFIFAGDLCDPDTTRSFRAISLAIEIALYLSDKDTPSVWIAGNHDVIENDRGSTTLEPLRAVARYSDSICVYESPDTACFGSSFLVLLPYVARTNSYDPAKFVESQIPWNVNPPSSGNCLVIGHLTVSSAERGSESDDFARGRDMIFPVEACRKMWGDRCILVNGHYHRKQVTRDGVHIPGSLARLRHDEEQHEPGYLVIEV